MTRIFNFFQKTTLVAGIITCFGAIGADERYTELKQITPPEVWETLVIGLLLLAPSIITVIIHDLRKKGE